jgi:hypothetical protein
MTLESRPLNVSLALFVRVLGRGADALEESLLTSQGVVDVVATGADSAVRPVAAR